MTTVLERTRASRWAAEVLRELQADPSMPLAVAARARSIFEAYPSADLIDALERNASTLLALDQVRAIDETRVLIKALPGLGVIACVPLNLYERVLRHFPLSGEGNAGFLIPPRVAVS